MSVPRAIDADGHITEGHVDWAARLPEEFKDRAPVTVRDEHDAAQMLIDGYRWPNPVAEGKGRWVSNQVKVKANPEGMRNPLARLPDMDAEGIDVAVLYGTTIAFHGSSTSDSRLSAAICHAWNTWAAEYCAADPQRLKFAALVPMGDAHLAAEEAERAVRDCGAVGITVLPNHM